MEQLLHILKSFIKKNNRENPAPDFNKSVEHLSKARIRETADKFHLRKIKNVFTDSKMLQKCFDWSQNLGMHHKYKKKKEKEKKKGSFDKGVITITGKHQL